MSLAVTHFAAGATLTTLALAALRPRTDRARTLAVVGGLWAMAPDAEKLVDSPAFAGSTTGGGSTSSGFTEPSTRSTRPTPRWRVPSR